MKKLLLFFAILLPLTAASARPLRSVSRADVNAIISEYRKYDGVEVIKLGPLAAALARGIIRQVDFDEDMAVIWNAMRGVKGLTVLEYGSADPDVRKQLMRRITRVLNDRDLLMEAKDSGSGMQLFGVVDDKAGIVRDFVCYAPESHALICLFGKVPVDAVAKMMAE